MSSDDDQMDVETPESLKKTRTREAKTHTRSLTALTNALRRREATQVIAREAFACNRKLLNAIDAHDKYVNHPDTHATAEDDRWVEARRHDHDVALNEAQAYCDENGGKFNCRDNLEFETSRVYSRAGTPEVAIGQQSMTVETQAAAAAASLEGTDSAIGGNAVEKVKTDGIVVGEVTTAAPQAVDAAGVSRQPTSLPSNPAAPVNTTAQGNAPTSTSNPAGPTAIATVEEVVAKYMQAMTRTMIDNNQKLMTRLVHLEQDVTGQMALSNDHFGKKFIDLQIEMSNQAQKIRADMKGQIEEEVKMGISHFAGDVEAEDSASENSVENPEEADQQPKEDAPSKMPIWQSTPKAPKSSLATRSAAAKTVQLDVPEEDDFPCTLPLGVTRSNITRAPEATASMHGNSTSIVSKLVRMPKLELRPFDGDVKNWPSFISTFYAFVHGQCSNNVERLCALQQVLTPKVRARVEEFMYDPGHYADALRKLERYYGRPNDMVRLHLESLKALPKVKKDDVESLRDFADALHSIVAAIKLAGHSHELKGRIVLMVAVQQAPPEVIDKWSTHEYRESKRSANAELGLMEFDAWLAEYLEIKLMKTAYIAKPVNAASANDSKSSSKKKNVNATSTSNSEAKKEEAQGSTTPKAPEADVKKDFSDKKNLPCIICKGTPRHPVDKCDTFKKLTVKKRWALVNEKRLCKRCIAGTHRAQECRTGLPCGVKDCKKLHHTFLHEEEAPPAPTVCVVRTRRAPAIRTVRKAINQFRYEKLKPVLLMIVQVRLRHRGRTLDTFAFLDSGSDTTLVSRRAADRLKVRGATTKIEFGSWRAEGTSTIESTQARLEILSRDEAACFTVKRAYVVPDLEVTDQKYAGGYKLAEVWPHLEGIDIPNVNGSEIDVLLGMDVAAAHIQLGNRQPVPPAEGPIAFSTPFGWCLAGNSSAPAITRRRPKRVNVTRIVTAGDEMRLHELMEKFWRTEDLGTKVNAKKLMPEDDAAGLAILKETAQCIQKRFKIGLMWRVPRPNLPCNHSAALKSQFALERRFAADVDYALGYVSVMRAVIDGGYAYEVPAEQLGQSPPWTWYLPHHGVVNPNKPGKVRVVSDAARKFAGTCLNDHLLKGPDLFTSLLGVLLRFRRSNIGLSADIASMYYQVQVPEEDQPAFSFLWREPGEKTPPRVYRMRVHIFGAVSSPATCIYALQRTALDNAGAYPDVFARILDSFFVDDYLDSVEELLEAIRRTKRLPAVLQEGGFHLTKWMSSSREVLASIAPEERSKPMLNLDVDDLPVERTLGVVWDAESDVFQFKVKTEKAAAETT